METILAKHLTFTFANAVFAVRTAGERIHSLELQRLILAFISIFLLLCVLAIILYHIRYKRINLPHFDASPTEGISARDRVESYAKGQEDERERISKELHDGACSAILGVRFMIEPYAHENEHLKRAAEWLRSIHSDLRNMSHNLAPNELFDGDLSHALELTLERSCVKAGLRFNFTQTNSINWSAFPRHIQHNLYRTIQELICNTIKHSNASLVEVSLSSFDSLLSINIEDNSSNFEAHKNNGLGLESIQSRIEGIGGKMEFFKTPEGVVYHIEVGS